MATSPLSLSVHTQRQTIGFHLHQIGGPGVVANKEDVDELAAGGGGDLGWTETPPQDLAHRHRHVEAGNGKGERLQIVFVQNRFTEACQQVCKEGGGVV